MFFFFEKSKGECFLGVVVPAKACVVTEGSIIYADGNMSVVVGHRNESLFSCGLVVGA